MKILLIGGNGYVGSRLYDFIKNKFEVVNVDVCWQDVLYPEIIVKNYRDLTKEFISEFSHIILLAGHSSVSMCDSLTNPIENNVSSFVNLIEKMDDSQTLIYTSTAAVYGSNPNFVDESSPLQEAINFYDFTKIINEKIIDLYPNKNIIALRLGSVGGFSKNFRRENLMNAISMSVYNDNKITISNPDNYRSVLGIVDLCKSIEKILILGVKKRIYNLTSINDKIINFGLSLQKLTNCELIINDSLKTKYSFNCSNERFEIDYDFKFKDTIESIYRDIVDNIDNIIINVPRKSI